MGMVYRRYGLSKHACTYIWCVYTGMYVEIDHGIQWRAPQIPRFGCLPALYHWWLKRPRRWKSSGQMHVPAGRRVIRITFYEWTGLMHE